jgi:nitrogen regulatory protein PII
VKLVTAVITPSELDEVEETLTSFAAGEMGHDAL